jgi:hypothetical protein
MQEEQSANAGGHLVPLAIARGSLLYSVYNI